MDVQLIKDYLKSFEIPKNIIKREIEIEELPNKAIFLIGPRRAGKTYLMYQIIQTKSKYIYLNFEHLALYYLNINEIYKVIFKIYPELFNSLPKFVFLDEIQVIDNWNVLVRTLLEKNLTVYVTGSSSKLLSKEIATNLRGRSLSYYVLPFSFKEFLKTEGISLDLETLEGVGKIKYHLENYLTYGGFPEVVLYKNPKIIREYVDLAFFKDFVERFKIQNIELAKYLFYNSIQNFACETSVHSLGKKLKSYGLKFDVHTLYKYFSMLEETLFIFRVKQYSFKSLIREFGVFKLYLCDVGITRLFSFTQDKGKLLENTVFLHLYRMKNKFPNLEIYFYKTKNNKEIDFIIKDKTISLIEVTYELDQEHVNKVFKALNELNLKEGLIITWDDEDEIRRNNKIIKVIPLWKWLLSNKLFL